MCAKMEKNCKEKILTIPNLLSLLRLAMIPVMMWLYLVRKNYGLTTLVLILSGLTDVADGYIARRFNMVSDFGKAFDPVADKLTQIAMLFCLVSRFPLMLLPLVILVIKECFTGITSLLAIRKTGCVKGAVWHGKVTTALLYATLAVHLLWYEISPAVSLVLICLCTVMMLISAVGYAIRNFRMLTGKTEKRQSSTFLTRILYRIFRRLILIFYPKIQVEGVENLPNEASILVGNHAQMNGPICSELFLPGEPVTWCAHQMMEAKEVPSYAFEDFWSRKPKWTHPFYRLLAYIITPFSVCLFNEARTIAVYHDTRLVSTFKQTVKALEDGKNVTIFPECYTPHNNIVHTFQDKYIDIAKLYYKRTGKFLNFVPVYIAPKLKKVYIGKAISFCPENSMEQERQRISTYLMDAITDIAVHLPLHTVVPYPNISKKDYPTNIPKE